MKKLLYLFLLPSVLFSQTTPSVTPRVDGEGSLGTETYRWGEGHFDELYVEAPSLSDDSNRVPTTSWVNNLIQSDVDLISYTVKNSSFTAEPNKKYVVNTTSSDVTVTLPMLSGELVDSTIIIRHSAGTNNIIINRAGSNIIVDGGSNLTSFTFKGLGSEVELTAYTTYAWVIIRSNRTIEPAESSDTNVAATTAWVNDLVEGNISNITTLLSGYLKKNSYPTGYQTHEGELILDSDWGEKILTLDMPDYGNLNAMWALDYDGIIDVMAQDYDPYTSKLLMSFKDLFTSSPYTEFVQPVKAPTPAAADDSTNVATTAWVQDEIATKAGLTDPVFTDSLTIESEANSEPLQFDFQGGLADSTFGFKWDADGNIMKLGITNETTVTYNSLLEFQTMDVPATTSIVSNVPLFVPDQGVVEYDDDRVATTEWVNWAISEAGGGTTEDPVFTGVVTAPTIYSEQETNKLIKIINPSGGAKYADISGGDHNIYLTFPEFSSNNSFNVSLKIKIDGKLELLFWGRISGSDLFDIEINGIVADVVTYPITVKTGSATPSSGKYKLVISLEGVQGSPVAVTIDEVVFTTLTDYTGTIEEEYKEPFTVSAGALPTGYSVIHTDYVYPSITTNSNNLITGAILTEATPASSSATGTKGMIRYDSTYVYVCVATDTWIRFEKATW